MCQHYLTVAPFFSAFPFPFSLLTHPETDKRAIVCAWTQCQVIMNMWTRSSCAITRVRSNQLPFDWPITDELLADVQWLIQCLIPLKLTMPLSKLGNSYERMSCRRTNHFICLITDDKKCLSWDNLINAKWNRRRRKCGPNGIGKEK